MERAYSERFRKWQPCNSQYKQKSTEHRKVFAQMISLKKRKKDSFPFALIRKEQKEGADKHTKERVCEPDDFYQQ